MCGVKPPEKSVVTVTEMAELCQISRSRFYDLLEAGVFPMPTTHPTSSRPMYDRALMEKCLEIRASGIGANGVPVLFNRKPRRPPAPRPPKPTPEAGADAAELVLALKGLGLTTTAQAVAEAVAALYPAGLAGTDRGDVVRKLFLHLHGRRA
jgi:hypothetical protein